MSRVLGSSGGVVLVAALCVMALLMVLGSAAMTMSELGYISFSAERSYQKANWAAEYAVKQGARFVGTSCPSSEGSGAAGDASFTYRYQAMGPNLCLVQGIGSHANAQVVKAGVVPFGRFRPDYGALTLRSGGSLKLYSTGLVSNCDASCPSPGVLAGGLLRYEGPSPFNTANCPTEARGVYGSPDGIQDADGSRCVPSPDGGGGACTGTELTDRIGHVFNNASDWKSLQAVLSALPIGPGLTLDVESLTVSGLVQAPEPSCTCTDSDDFTLSPSTSSCTGVTSFSGCGGQIRFSNASGVITAHGVPASLHTVVSAKPLLFVGVSFGDGDLSGKRFFTTGTASITINDSDIRALNVSAGDPTIFSAGGTLTISRAGTIMRGLLISRGGDMDIRSGNLTDSIVVMTGSTGSLILRGAALKNSRLVSTQSLRYENADSVEDSLIYSRSTVINAGGGAMRGTLLYTTGDLTVPGGGAGSRQIGSATEPALVIIGGDLLLQHSDAIDVQGLVFVEGTLVHQGAGNVRVKGAVIANGRSGQNSLQLGSNSALRFSPDVIERLSSVDTFRGLVKKPTCARGFTGERKADYFRATRITAY